jgi:hypothetical protein
MNMIKYAVNLKMFLSLEVISSMGLFCGRNRL